MLEKREINQNNIKALIEKKFYDACKGTNIFLLLLPENTFEN